MLNVILSDQPNLISELWEYFVDKYFSPEIPYLENFSLGTGTMLSAQLIILGITIGLIIASACNIYTKRYIGDFIRKVIYEECFDASSAKTLYELGYLKNPGIRNVIKSNGSLSRWIRCVEEDEHLAKIEQMRIEFEEKHKNDKKPPKFIAPEFKRDCNTMHFYLPEEKKYAADIRFDSKGANWISFLLVTVISIVMCAFVCYVFPDILKMVDNFLSIIK